MNVREVDRAEKGEPRDATSETSRGSRLDRSIVEQEGRGTHPSPLDAEGACDLIFCAFALEYLSSSSSYPRRCIATVGRTKHTRRRPAR